MSLNESGRPTDSEQSGTCGLSKSVNKSSQWTDSKHSSHWDQPLLVTGKAYVFDLVVNAKQQRGLVA